jgi:hypothetical protein
MSPQQGDIDDFDEDNVEVQVLSEDEEGIVV